MDYKREASLGVALILADTSEWNGNLLIRKLWLTNSGKPVDMVNVYSGAVGTQVRLPISSDYPGSLRPLPVGIYRVSRPEYAEGGDWSEAIGPVWIDLQPETNVNGRSAFGIHLDGNYYTPRGQGSAGCIVTPHRKDLQRIEFWLSMRNRPKKLYVIPEWRAVSLI